MCVGGGVKSLCFEKFETRVGFKKFFDKNCKVFNFRRQVFGIQKKTF